MVYISSDGTTSTKRKRKWGFLGINFIKETIVSAFDFVGLFFRTLTSSPATLENERGQRRTTYSERQGFRGGNSGGANIRGVSRLGTARAAAGG